MILFFLANLKLPFDHHLTRIERKQINLVLGAFPQKMKRASFSIFQQEKPGEQVLKATNL